MCARVTGRSTGDGEGTYDRCRRPQWINSVDLLSGDVITQPRTTTTTTTTTFANATVVPTLYIYNNIYIYIYSGLWRHIIIAAEFFRFSSVQRARQEFAFKKRFLPPTSYTTLFLLSELPLIATIRSLTWRFFSFLNGTYYQLNWLPESMNSDRIGFFHWNSWRFVLYNTANAGVTVTITPIRKQ